MFDLSPDTTPDAAAVQHAGWRAMSDEKKLQIVFNSSSAMRQVAFAGIRMRHPDYDDRRVGLAWLRLTMGRDAFRRLFPDDDVEP